MKLPRVPSMLASGEDAPSEAPLAAEDFCLFSGSGGQCVARPSPPAFYFQFNSSAPGHGLDAADLLTRRGLRLGAKSEDVFRRYAGIPGSVSTPHLGAAGLLKVLPDTTAWQDALAALSEYKLLYVLWYVNDEAMLPRRFWGKVAQEEITPGDVADYCELAFTIQNAVVQNIEIVCNYNTSVHLWHLVGEVPFL